MKKIIWLTIIFSLFGFAPIVYLDITGNNSYKEIGLAYLIALEIIIMSVIGLLLFAFEKTKLYGTAILLSAGNVLLIGFSVCTFG